MKTKYNFDFNTDIVLRDVNRLTNQLWKLIPMRENNEDWSTQLDTVLIELTGMGSLLCLQDNFLILLTKLEGLKIVETDFFLYRKTVFETISLLREVFKHVTQ